MAEKKMPCTVRSCSTKYHDGVKTVCNEFSCCIGLSDVDFHPLLLSNSFGHAKHVDNLLNLAQLYRLAGVQS